MKKIRFINVNRFIIIHVENHENGEMVMSMHTKATILLVVVNFFWGLSYIFMKMGIASIEPFNLVALRCLIAFVIAATFFYRSLRHVNMELLFYSFLLGFLLLLVFSLVTVGLTMTDASNAGFLLSMTVIFVPVIQSILQRRLPIVPVRIGIIITFVGIIIMTITQSLSFNYGDILCMLSALAYAIQILIIGRVTKDHDPITVGIMQLGFAGILALVLSSFFESPILPQNTVAWMSILGLAILCSAFGFISQAVAQKHTSPTQTSLMFSLEPLFAAGLAVIILGEAFTIRDIIGAFLIICGVIVATLGSYRVPVKVKTEQTMEQKTEKILL